MKKSLLLVIAGFMFFALTSFTDGNEPTTTTENTTSVSTPDKESKEFAATKALFKKYEALFKKATTCEEMEQITYDMAEEELPEFAEKDKMTEEEQEEMQKIAMNFVMMVQRKVTELGCE